MAHGTDNEVLVYHAGSLNRLINQDLSPGFTAVTGYRLTNVPGPSVGLANQIRQGEIVPDVFMTADAEVNDEVLIGAANGDHVRWYFVMCRQKMVIAYGPESRFKAELDAVAAGAKPWYEVLQSPGLVLKRTDPRTDPGGYRVVFLFDLAERHYGIPGLKDRVLQGDDNEAQILTGRDTQQSVTPDAYVTYLTNAVGMGQAYLTLPDEIDLSNPSMTAWYRTASYTNPHGQTFRGSPMVYGVAIPRVARNRPGAEAFIRYLLSPTGRAAMEQHGFLPADVLVGGDEYSVPPSLRGLIQGTYAP